MKTAALVCVATIILGTVLAGCEPTASRPATMKAPSQAVSELVMPADKATPFITEKDFVMNWLVLGPIAFTESDFGGDEQQPSADNEFVKNEAALDGTQKAPQGATWQEKLFKGDVQAGQVDLNALYNEADHSAAYAVAWLKCTDDVKDAKLYVGSDDYLKVWINGKLVHTYKTARRASNQDQDCIKGIRLEKGYNHVVVKCVDVVLGWDFYFRLTDAKDRPIVAKPVVKMK